jgi:hypothetical protein
MVNKRSWLGILVVVVLVFGMTVVGCGDDGSDNGDGGNGNGNGNSGGGQNLPPASGTNAVGGKTYYGGISTFYGHLQKTVFSVTADSAANGTYVVTTVDNGTYSYGVKYTFTTQIETGTYSWNEEAKTVTLKPEMCAIHYGGSFGHYGDYSESEWYELIFSPLKNKAGYRSEMQNMIDAYRNEYGQEVLNQHLSSMGFSSVSAYLDYAVNEAFANKVNGYSFGANGAALFLEKSLPANKGTNEFSGQTYYGWDWDGNGYVKDNEQKYVFTASGYTFTDSSYGGTPYTETGTYAYDSTRKIVWLRPSTINGQNRASYYASTTAYYGHHYPDDNAYRSAITNSGFNLHYPYYNSTNKIIGYWED